MINSMRSQFVLYPLASEPGITFDGQNQSYQPLQPRPQRLLVFQYGRILSYSCHIGKREDPGDEVAAD